MFIRINDYILERHMYHVTSTGLDVDNLTPNTNWCDNKMSMLHGRDTGHFGSGIYFSTYQGRYDDRSDSTEDNLIKVSDTAAGTGGIYRVNDSIYKNLYRCYNNMQASTLFTLLRQINSLYNSYVYKSDSKSFYLKASHNASQLNLKMPSYKQILSMCKELADAGDSDTTSFSTKFMIYNGFNGVNVSLLDGWDNTTHGSVIYDITKTSSEDIYQVSPKDNLRYNSGRLTNDIYTSYDDDTHVHLLDKNSERLFLRNEELDKLSTSQILSYINVLEYIIPFSKLQYLDDKYIRLYLTVLSKKLPELSKKIWNNRGCVVYDDIQKHVEYMAENGMYDTLRKCVYTDEKGNTMTALYKFITTCFDSSLIIEVLLHLKDKLYKAEKEYLEKNRIDIDLYAEHPDSLYKTDAYKLITDLGIEDLIPELCEYAKNDMFESLPGLISYIVASIMPDDPDRANVLLNQTKILAKYIKE